MKLMDKKDMSEWAYWQCHNGDDTEEIRNLITDSKWAHFYCYFIKDREEMWNKIKESVWAFNYCFNIKNRLEVRRYIKEKKALLNLDIMIEEREITGGNIDCNYMDLAELVNENYYI